MSEETDNQTDTLPSGVAAATSGSGFIWCDMCGYNATLTPLQMEIMNRQEHTEWCRRCRNYGDDSMLIHGTTLADHIAEDEPMPTHTLRD